jgi:hypothetical protein
VKVRLDIGLQIHLDHLLRHAIRYRWDAQLSLPPITFSNPYRAHWWWEVTARAHSIPDLIKVVLKTRLKIFNRLPVDSRCPLVRLYTSVGFPNNLLGNTEWLCFRNRLLPLSG